MLVRARKLKEYFAKATKQICGEAYPTLSYVIPIYNILLNKLEDFWDTPNRFENGKVSELYMTLYAPQETQNTNIKYNSSDENLVSHISKWRRIETVSEFDRYLNADHAQQHKLCVIL
ncbi:unnamed protein product [Rhizophagus irregularis]|nr:unnamed protein product [Rhizophagus irregularis]